MLDFDLELTQYTQTIQEKIATEQKDALMRNVYVLNDDFTPMEFVVDLIQNVFKLETRHAERVTMEAHFKGKALCGKYPKDLAETMACKAISIAKQAGHPLMVITSRS
ncbi:ATP-dependent Clp protease adaptor ClpS [Fastidiosibacter lacustris]|uniref:ATP-dependent Clp protease adaptor ClpS n=1 Tax=Fastidiosibacter lacustris TaxID=2056695 RepID=UPI00195DA9EC|nr:ATP-dependent Clp protease adaptor ClpS [Fastidiosibacter lacustris]